MTAVSYRRGPMSPRAQNPTAPAQARGRPRGRPRNEESVDEEAFLDAALRAFAVQGYDAVSVRTLNKELGVSHSWVHQRFGSKRGLWYAAVDHGFGRQAATIRFDPTITDPLEQLERTVRWFLRSSAEHPELGQIMTSEGMAESERLDYLFERFIAPPLASLERLLEHLIAEGRVRPIEMRTLFLLIAHGAAAPFTMAPLSRHLATSGSLQGDAVDDHIEVATRVIIDGLRAPS